MRVWVTRAAPEAEATAQRLRELGHSPLVAPLLEIRPAEGPPPDLVGVAALAFTSRNGVRAFGALCRERSLPAFAVGAATARAARDVGFRTVLSAEGDSTALAALIAAHAASIDGEVLYAAPEAPAADLVGELTSRGLKARAHAVYRSAPAGMPEAALAALQAEPLELDAVLIHSPEGARQMAEIPLLARAARALSAYCISPRAAEPLAGLDFRSIMTAPFPNEASLLNLLGG
jgi:uroporphyrinogen-III synthase